MSYDKKVHIPQRLETFLQGFEAGNKDALERTISNLKDLLDDDMFSEKLNNIDNARNEKIDNVKKKALDSLKTILESKETDDLFIDVNEIFTDLQSTINEIEEGYWEKVRDYVLDSAEKL